MIELQNLYIGQNIKIVYKLKEWFVIGGILLYEKALHRRKNYWADNCYNASSFFNIFCNKSTRNRRNK